MWYARKKCNNKIAMAKDTWFFEVTYIKAF